MWARVHIHKQLDETFKKTMNYFGDQRNILQREPVYWVRKAF